MRRQRRASQDYRDFMLSTNPVAYWRLGEASGSVARDEMGVYDGTYFGSPTLGVPGLLTGDGDTAVTFAAALSQRMGVAAGGPSGTAVWSMAAWVRPSILPQAGGSLAFGGAFGGAGFGIGNGAGGSGTHLEFLTSSVVWIDGVYVFSDTTSAHFVVLLRDGSTLRAYVDALQVATSASVPNVGNGSVDVGLFGGSQMFSGTIDEPAIWNRALTAAEIAEMYRIGMGR